MSISETATREQLIDPLLRAAGWNLKDRTQVDFEIPVDGYDKEPWNGITDYCLFHPSGEVLAVVEAKKTSRDPREGQEQLRIYLDKVAAREGQTFVPFGFMTNGKDVFYWDSGAENPRLVAGFFTRDDLKRLLFDLPHKWLFNVSCLLQGFEVPIFATRSRFFEIARLLLRLDHVGSRIVNANQGII